MNVRTLLIPALAFAASIIGCQKDHANSKQQPPRFLGLAAPDPQVSPTATIAAAEPTVIGVNTTVIGVNTTNVNWDDGKLVGVRVAILATDGFEEAELVDPRQAYADEGASTVILSPKTGEIQGYKDDTKAGRVKVDMTIEEADPEQFDALALPGGVVNGDSMRTDPSATAFVKAFGQSHKPIAAIGDGLSTMIEADVVRGHTVTSVRSLKTGLKNAGAKWAYKAVVVDRNFVTSRKLDDIPAFNDKAIKVFAKRRLAIGGGPPRE
jgi:deglycase